MCRGGVGEMVRRSLTRPNRLAYYWPKLHNDIRRATTEKFIIIHIENCCHTVYFKIAEEIEDTIACIIFVGVKRAL
jgi:hypothetical protein